MDTEIVKSYCEDAREKVSLFSFNLELTKLNWKHKTSIPREKLFNKESKWLSLHLNEESLSLPLFCFRGRIHSEHLYGHTSTSDISSKDFEDKNCCLSYSEQIKEWMCNLTPDTSQRQMC